MRELWHGRIEDLLVAAGEPRITRKTKLLARHRGYLCEAPAAGRPAHQNCRPHPQQAKLWEYCRRLGDGVIARIEIADGLPIFWGANSQSGGRSCQ